MGVWYETSHILPMAWYLVLMVVGWWRTRMSPSNSQQATGFRLGCTSTIPLRIWLRRICMEDVLYALILVPMLLNQRQVRMQLNYFTFLSAKEAVCPPRTSVTGSLFRWTPRIETGMNSPMEVGPIRRTSFIWTTPCMHVPDTTVPTPCRLVTKIN